jgi:hypothetical protein
MLRSNTVGRIAIGVVSLFGFTLAILLFFYAAEPLVDHAATPIFGSRIRDTAIFGPIGLSIVFVSLRLIQGRNWAWWIALAVSLITLGCGAFVFVSWIHPRDDFARSEGGYAFVLSLFLIAPGALNAILLSLPFVRRRFSLPGCRMSRI